MEHSHVDELLPAVVNAGFADVRHGTVRSWLRHVTATKPNLM
jgi:hypothetical protein